MSQYYNTQHQQVGAPIDQHAHENPQFSMAMLEKYFQNDMLYVAIGYFHDYKQQMFLAILFSLIFFFIGKAIGAKSPSVLQVLKQKYNNIDHQNEKNRKSLFFYDKILKLLKYISYFVIFTLLALIGVFAYIANFDVIALYRLCLMSTIQRDVAIILIIVYLLLASIKQLIKRLKSSIMLHIRETTKGLDSIGKQLIDTLGNDMVQVLKKQLNIQVNASPVKRQAQQQQNQAIPSRKGSVQEPVVSHAKPKQEPQKPVQPIIKGIPHRDVEQMLVAQNAKFQLEKNIIRADLERHKKLIRSIKDFKWCDYCVYAANPPQIIEENEDDETEYTESENKINSKVIEEIPEEHKNDITEEAKQPEGSSNGEDDKQKGDSIDALDNSAVEPELPVFNHSLSRGSSTPMQEMPSSCQDNCLQRYFDNSIKISTEFEKQKGQIRQLRQQYSEIFQNQAKNKAKSLDLNMTVSGVSGVSGPGATSLADNEKLNTPRD